jgi:hypothetical protein
MDNCAKESIGKLRKLREKLCNNQTQWKQAFAIKDAVVGELRSLKELASDPSSNKKNIIKKINSLLILIDPDYDCGKENVDV